VSARARLEQERAEIEQQGRAGAARRKQLAGERRPLTQALIRARLRRMSRPLALAAVAFALGIGASGLWQQPLAPGERSAARAGPLLLKLDTDSAGFAARAAAAGQKQR